MELRKRPGKSNPSNLKPSNSADSDQKLAGDAAHPDRNTAGAPSAGAGRQIERRSALAQCCRVVCNMLCWLTALLVLGGLGCYTCYYEESQLVLMRFFRDLSRAKAHARLHGDSNALMTMLTRNDEVLPLKEDEDEGMRFTAEDLAKFNGEDGAPIYLAIMGRVYDVSRGKAFYGVGRSYHHYVAKDATRSFATGCTKPECLVPSLVGLSEAQKQEGRKWLELYEYHDKYKFLGHTVADAVGDLVEQAMLEDEAIQAARDAEAGFVGEDGKAASFEVIRTKARDLYRELRVDEALSYFNTALVLLGEARAQDSVRVVLNRTDVLVTMAALAQKQQRFTQARESYQEALDGMIEALGAEAAQRHPMYARAVSDKAASYFMTNEAVEAIAGFRTAIGVYDNAIASGEDEIAANGAGEESLARTVLERSNSRLNLALAMLQTAEADGPAVTEAREIFASLVVEHEPEVATADPGAEGDAKRQSNLATRIVSVAKRNLAAIDEQRASDRTGETGVEASAHGTADDR